MLSTRGLILLLSVLMIASVAAVKDRGTLFLVTSENQVGWVEIDVFSYGGM